MHKILSFIIWILYFYSFIMAITLFINLLKYFKIIQKEQSSNFEKFEALLKKITEPVLAKIRPIVLIKSEVDLSPLVAIVIIYFFTILISFAL